MVRVVLIYSIPEKFLAQTTDTLSAGRPLQQQQPAAKLNSRTHICYLGLLLSQLQLKMERAAASAVQRAVGLCVLNALHYNLVGKNVTRVIGYVFNWLIYYLYNKIISSSE